DHGPNSVGRLASKSGALIHQQYCLLDFMFEIKFRDKKMKIILEFLFFWAKKLENYFQNETWQQSWIRL
ncbi:hypothetical protein ACJX0J_029922, partial [Zea mays]